MKKHGEMSGKYGEEDEQNDEQQHLKPPSRPRSKKFGRASYENAVGLNEKDVPEIMDEDNDKKENSITNSATSKQASITDDEIKETIEEQDARLKREAMMGSGGSNKTTGQGNPTRKETIEEQDARLKREAMMGGGTGVASASADQVKGGPELIPDEHQFASDTMTTKPGAVAVAGTDHNSKDKSKEYDAASESVGVLRGTDADLDDEKQDGKGGSAFARAVIPGAVAVSSSNNGQTAKKGAPALFPSDAEEGGTGSNKRTGQKGTPGLFPTDVEEQGEGGEQIPRLLDNAAEPDIDIEMESSSNNNTNEALVNGNANRQGMPGAVRVSGIDAVQGTDEEDLHDEYDTEAQEVVQESHPGADGLSSGTTALPTAIAVEEEDDEEAGQAENDEIFALYQRAEVAETEPKEESKGILGWVGRHPYLAALLMILMVGGIIGGVIAATSGGGNSGSGSGESSQGTRAPAPTLAPTSELQGKLLKILSQNTAESLLFDTSTPQGQAFRFMLEEDSYSYSLEDGDSEDVKLSERFALVTFFYATNGHQWVQNCSFLSDVDYCEWRVTNDVGTLIGVQRCTDEGRVGVLLLPDLDLNGTIPPEVGAFSNITEFSIARNPALIGTLPEEFFELTSLNDIRIFSNSLSGTLSPAIGDLSMLTYLAMQENNFIGNIPTTIGNLVLLERWFVEENNFSGEVPSEIGNLASLAIWFASDMALSGSLPSEVSRMTSLETLYIDGNDITDGMNNFCTENFTLNTFQADCLENSFPFEEAQVECSCCSSCCNDALNACLPNGAF